MFRNVFIFCAVDLGVRTGDWHGVGSRADTAAFARLISSCLVSAEPMPGMPPRTGQLPKLMANLWHGHWGQNPKNTVEGQVIPKRGCSQGPIQPGQRWKASIQVLEREFAEFAGFLFNVSHLCQALTDTRNACHSFYDLLTTESWRCRGSPAKSEDEGKHCFIFTVAPSVSWNRIYQLKASSVGSCAKCGFDMPWPGAEWKERSVTDSAWLRFSATSSRPHGITQPCPGASALTTRQRSARRTRIPSVQCQLEIP